MAILTITNPKSQILIPVATHVVITMGFMVQALVLVMAILIQDGAFRSDLVTDMATATDIHIMIPIIMGIILTILIIHITMIITTRLITHIHIILIMDTEILFHQPIITIQEEAR
jgi:hypothetical protein